jgi:hypothetical protein
MEDIKVKRGPGRCPALKPDKKTLDMLHGLGEIHCTVAEAASVLSVHKKTLHEFIARHPIAREAWEDGSNQGKASLRRQQCDMAKTNPTMAIWLGKQLLGQTDRRELSGPGGGAIPLDIDVTKLTEQQLAQLEDILEAVTEPIALEAVTEG